jgi:SH3-like domain-containing protein
MRNSSTSRTLRVLDSGDKVVVLERQDNWYRVRYNDEVEGWMEESTVVTNSTLDKIKSLVSASEGQTPQNTAVVREEANFRIDPGRNTSIIRRLGSGTKVEVIDRVTTPRPGSDSAWDVWVKVRPSPTEVGWLFGGLLDFDIPADVAGYSEGYVYSAVKTINRVDDSIAGPVNWYIVGEHKNGMDPHLDFDGIRVFTWNMKRHRYETAYRVKGLRGVYPIEIGQSSTGPTFRIYELSGDRSAKTHRDFVMYGVVVREKKES